jgi:hypothetical protein
MGKINWNDFQARAAELEARQQQMNGPYVGFFTLKNDGDEAIVRIMHDTAQSFDIRTVHSANIDGRFRLVNCLREANEPLESCPMCVAQSEVKNKIYVHLIKYTMDEEGKIVATPVFWERPVSYAYQLKDLINEYGPLSESLFKIKRSGEKGNLKTTYSTMYCSPMVYKNELYPKLEGAFDGFNPVGRVILRKTAEDMNYFLANGKFPSTGNTSTPSVSAPTLNPEVVPQSDSGTTSAPGTTGAPARPMPWEKSSTGGAIQRYY